MLVSDLTKQFIANARTNVQVRILACIALETYSLKQQSRSFSFEKYEAELLETAGTIYGASSIGNYVRVAKKFHFQHGKKLVNYNFSETGVLRLVQYIVTEISKTEHRMTLTGLRRFLAGHSPIKNSKKFAITPERAKNIIRSDIASVDRKVKSATAASAHSKPKLVLVKPATQEPEKNSGRFP